MNKSLTHISHRIYGSLINLYPSCYKMEFGDEMQYVFSESLKDAYARDQEIGIFRFWAMTGIDLFSSLATQHIDNQKRKFVMEINSGKHIDQRKIIFRMLLVTGLILLIPWLAMQFTDAVVWDIFDFIVAGTLLFGTGFVFWLLTRKMSNAGNRRAVGIALGLALVLVWIELAVGIF